MMQRTKVALGRCSTYAIALLPALGLVGDEGASSALIALQLVMLVNSIVTQLFPLLESAVGYLRCRAGGGDGGEVEKPHSIAFQGAGMAAMTVQQPTGRGLSADKPIGTPLDDSNGSTPESVPPSSRHAYSPAAGRPQWHEEGGRTLTMV